ncbi:hypothetical protein BT96DRAFT_1015953 [Gymnopus androsaceus JB14]|uniref:Zn(2)-C6 fungal-type domain-containing protein n=1 Tax=Gymnopus androsaceus JB14 TaxID=1447944 RepID=A0A6A4I6I8_9AGAR|nr:hypothetical protein BT96DRAFT_1015953 [Gymnopus androsaceus JB14]
MSDSEDSNGPSISLNHTRKRRAAKACDVCHRRKVRCEESSIPDICSNCLGLGIECTHPLQKKKRGPKTKIYQLEKPSDARSLISTILSSPKTVVIPKDESLMREILVTLASYGRNLEKQLEQALEQRPLPVSKTSPFSDTSDIDDPEESLTLQVKSLSLDVDHYNRHVGKSSHFMLLQTALSIRGETNGGNPAKTISVGIRRSEFWARAPWHRFLLEPEDPTYVFPQSDLLRDLLTLYFEKQHIILPVLHRQTFERQVYADQLHLIDQRFGAVVLAVCALGSKFSDDPRTLADGTKDLRSAGWRYFEQIRLVKIGFTGALSLYDIQLYSLASTFLFPTPLSDITWFLSGLGIRAAQEVGAHRRGNILKKPTQTRLEQEIWRRAFWSIITMDLYMCIATGRPRSTREADFDLEFPPECDDEYWEISSNPQMEFIQPLGKPSHMSYWHHFMKLLRITGLVKDHLFTTRKAAPWLKIVMELDSALNNWVDNIPEYLKWDPNRPDDILFAQTVMMHSNYYWVQIQIHKMFIRPGLLSTENFPSLAICTNASRAYIHILDAYMARPGMPLVPNYIAPIFAAATMLLINLWTSIRVKYSYDPRNDMTDVSNCLKHLAKFETRYENAGRLLFVKDSLPLFLLMNNLLSSSDILEAVISESVSQTPPPPQRDSLNHMRDFQTSQPHPMEDSQRQFAGSQQFFNALQSPTFSGPDQFASNAGAGAFHQPTAPGSAFDPFYAINMGLAPPTQQQSFGFDVQQPLQTSQSYRFGLLSSSADPLSGLDHPVASTALAAGSGTEASSTWSEPNQEDWTSFMLKVDELLKFVSPEL